MGSLKFQIDTALAHRLFEDRFGGIANFADEWAEQDKDGKSAQRSVKTIYAWLQNGLPTTKDTLYSFCAALDVDPVTLIDFDRGDLRKSFGRLRRSFLLGGLNAGGFRPLYDLFHPSRTWPPRGLSQKYYQRDWTTHQFEHLADTVVNTYAAITVSGDDSVPANWPRAFHIAYRRKQNVDGLWRPYGAVISRFGEAILAHENGDIQRMPLGSRSNHLLRFHTYFGPSPVEFRLTCLHPFAGSVEPTEDPAWPLRFIG